MRLGCACPFPVLRYSPLTLSPPLRCGPKTGSLRKKFHSLILELPNRRVLFGERQLSSLHTFIHQLERNGTTFRYSRVGRAQPPGTSLALQVTFNNSVAITERRQKLGVSQLHDSRHTVLAAPSISRREFFPFYEPEQ